MIVGAQLYTISNFAQDEAGIRASYQKLSEMGYRALHYSSIPMIGAEKLKEIAEQNGLYYVVSHIGVERLLHETDAVIEEHRIMGYRDIGIGGCSGRYREDGLNGMRAFIRDMKPAVEKMNAAGMKFHYHNHYQEFERFGGVTPMDLVLGETDWGVILDTYWVQYAGLDSAKTLRQMEGRVQFCHLKDMEISQMEQRMAPVGQGNLDWPEILAVCEETGVQYGLVEQDYTYGRDPFEEMRRSAENLRNMGAQF